MSTDFSIIITVPRTAFLMHNYLYTTHQLLPYRVQLSWCTWICTLHINYYRTYSVQLSWCTGICTLHTNYHRTVYSFPDAQGSVHYTPMITVPCTAFMYTTPQYPCNFALLGKLRKWKSSKFFLCGFCKYLPIPYAFRKNVTYTFCSCDLQELCT